MSATEAQAIAQQLGEIPINSEKLQSEIQRLNRKGYVPLQQVQMLHDWLEGKRQRKWLLSTSDGKGRYQSLVISN